MPIRFANAALLWGLALVALPLAIHLVSRRVARRMEFAAVQFVVRSLQRRSRRLRLRELLLLAARVVLIALLALSVARPETATPESAPPPQGTTVVLCLDGSASMRRRAQGERLFDLAVRRSISIVRRLDPSVPVGLYLAELEVVPAVEPATTDRAQVLRALEHLEPGYGTSDLGRCAERAAHVSAESRPRVVVVTDGARHAWPRRRVGGNVVLEVVTVPDSGEQVDNVGLAQVAAAPSQSGPAGSYDVEFTVTRSADSDAGERELPVTLFADDDSLAQVRVRLDSRGAVRRRFSEVPLAREDRNVWLHLTLPGDAYGLDDEAWLPLALPPRLAVLVVDGDPQTVAHRDEVFYLERALSADRSGAIEVVVRDADATTAADIAAADVIVLANVSRLDGEATKALRERVRGGAGLLVTSGSNVSPEFLNGDLAALVPGRVRWPKEFAAIGDPARRAALGVTIADRHHPIVESLGGQLGLERARVHTALLVDPDTDQRHDILRLSNGTPLLTEMTVGNGIAMLLTTSVDIEWGDLAIRPGFAPLMLQTVRYLGGALWRPKKRRFAVGERVEIAVPRGALGLVAVGPDGEVRGRAEESDSVSFRAERPGRYRVFAVTGSGRRPVPEEDFAVHVPAVESDMTPIDLDELAGRTDGGLAIVRHSATTGSRPLWPYAVAAMALVWVAETAIAARRRHPQNRRARRAH